MCNCSSGGPWLCLQLLPIGALVTASASSPRDGPAICATQSAQLAAKQQAEQADTSARLAALEQERAALQAKLAAEKARASEALTLEQLRQQHNERWWFTKQARCRPVHTVPYACSFSPQESLIASE